MKYYYLVASLPSLVLGEPPPLNMERLRFSCSTVLEPEDMAELERIAAGRDEECSGAFMQAWRDAEYQLRNAVAAVRAHRRNVEAQPHLREHRGFRVWIEKAVTDAFAKPNPAEREMALDRLRWQILDELSRQDPFGVGPVLAFALKLRMAERWARLDAAAGRRMLDGFVQQQAAGAVEPLIAQAEADTAAVPGA